ncbi:ATP-binding protein [Subsaxibacter sp. CAU 1640]|uniref:tetratricopeptide repeat-containing hybrid sensor histidine kinase/response regulator n=1 Tax=Subsaxibacter sp. CAU 1640 TaxID=2933271 RepID=UPI0020066F3F|nr:ATP-binding protein [Subsaxibacter sp. CAU 1640]MCK7590550.1 ATP-binding protein [Subsaxibacter sp. CAU 1640]
MISFPFFSQEKNKDSLFAVWSDTSNTPKERVNAYYHRFYPLQNEVASPEVMRWVKGSEKLQDMAKEAGLTDYLPFLKLLEYGKYFLLDDLETACPIARETFYMALEQKDYETLLLAYDFIWEFCYQRNIEFTAKDITRFEDILLDLQQKVTDPKLKIGFSQQVATKFFRESKYSEALPMFQTIIEYYDSHNMVKDNIYGTTLIRIGLIHQDLQNFGEAKIYYHRAKKVYDGLNNESFKMSLDLNLAQTFALEKHVDSAQIYIDNVFKYYTNMPECEPCMGRAYVVEALIMNSKGNYEQAINALLPLKPNTYDIVSKSGSINVERYYFAMAEAYLGLQQYQKAIENAKTGIHVSNKRDVIYRLRNYDVLFKAQEAMGQYKNALQSYVRYNTLNDSVAHLRNSHEVLRKELGFQFEKQRLADSLSMEQKRLESELVLQSEINDQKTTKNILIGLGILVALLAFGLYYRLKHIRKTQKIIQKEKEKAQASEKAKHQFLANMSHEIRTPMNAIKGMTDILLRRKPRKDQTEYLDGIKQSSDSLLVIINDILDISKIEAGKIELEHEPFSINEVVNNVQTIMQFKAEEKGLQLKTNLPQQEVMVKGDDTRLKQILINLIGNAIKFTEKGMVNITVTSKAENDKLKLHFTVSDTGIGIDKERIEKIFKSFEQAYSDTTRKFGGTGLGLSISKKLVELHNGKIWVESEKGKGSAFHFTIPYEIAESVSPKNKTTTSSENNIAHQLKGIKVLLVEDNQFNAVVAQEELEDAIENVAVDVAENGAIAVEKVKSSEYDVILMDVQMPIMNGYEATEKIRSLSNGKANITIIAMTANVLKEEVDKCYEAGMDDFIGKPFNTEQLLHKIYKLTKKQ